MPRRPPMRDGLVCIGNLTIDEAVSPAGQRSESVGGGGAQSPLPSTWALVRNVLSFCQLFCMCFGIVPSSRTFVTW